MWPDWLLPPLGQLAIVAVKAVGIYLAVVVCTRLAGLRSFSKIWSTTDRCCWSTAVRC
ncbi:MAG: hypothetical protein ABEK29_07930 [Bradymonadaceae bacterium]